MASSGLAWSLCKDVRAEGYASDVLADDLDTVAAPTFDTMLKEQFGEICLSTQNHAPEKVPACAYTQGMVFQTSQCAPRDHLQAMSSIKCSRTQHCRALETGKMACLFCQYNGLTQKKSETRVSAQFIRQCIAIHCDHGPWCQASGQPQVAGNDVKVLSLSLHMQQHTSTMPGLTKKCCQVLQLMLETLLTC